MRRIQVIDSHTAGEPTRVIVDGGPVLAGDSLAERREHFRSHFDEIRSAVVNEPRGSEIVVGALLCEPLDAGCAAGVIFFNNVGFLGMCGHGTIGLVATLAHLQRLAPGAHSVETPVGVVQTTLHQDSRVTVRNVPSYRLAAGVSVTLGDGQRLTGDVAWGGNWFFLTEDHGRPLERANIDQLTALARNIRQALADQNITGANGAEIDHIELLGPGSSSSDSRNFVLCPGGAYDRSPCGTGTSAKLACLAEEGKLAPHEIWRQESIVGSAFEATYELDGSAVVPSFTGTAYVTAEAVLILNPADPLRMGIRP